MDEIVEAGPERAIRVEVDPKTQEPTPFVAVRGRLEALLARPVFYELVENGISRETEQGEELGVYASGTYFPLGLL